MTKPHPKLSAHMPLRVMQCLAEIAMHSTERPEEERSKSTSTASTEDRQGSKQDYFR